MRKTKKIYPGVREGCHKVCLKKSLNRSWPPPPHQKMKFKKLNCGTLSFCIQTWKNSSLIVSCLILYLFFDDDADHDNDDHDHDDNDDYDVFS